MTTVPRSESLWGLLSLSLVLAWPAAAERFEYEPVSDADDGQLIDGFLWDPLPLETTIEHLLLRLGQEGASTYDVALGFALPDLSEGQTVTQARLRVNEQGSAITSGLSVEISAALDLDPLATAGAARFGLPRTNASVSWTIFTDWDSSGQIIAKYEETPDLSPIVNEVLSQSGWDGGPKVILLFLELSAAFGDNIVRFDDTHGAYWDSGNAGIQPARLRVAETFRDAFYGQELLCRPRPTAMDVNVIPHVNTDAYVEWGSDGVSFPNSTSTQFIAGGSARVFTMSGLSPDTEYFYRLMVRPAGGGAFQAGPVRSFLTLPVEGQEARMCVTTDMHVTNQLSLGLQTQMDLLETTLAFMPGYLAPERYHLWMDLGDLVVMRAQRLCFDQEEVEQRYRTAREYLDQAAHSLPLVFVRGNHEEVNGWDYDNTPNNIMIWSGKMLLKYFAPPLPNAYYSGNSVAYPDLGVPADYFAFDVGGLRVRALDPYLFSTTRPHNAHGQTGGSLNGWDWRLGTAQYLWLHDDLVTNAAPFSLVAIHHLSSCYIGSGQYYGRGGIEIVKYAVDGRPSFEWGGEDGTGADVLAVERPDFVYGAVHDLLVSNGNQVVLKGHDHFHARQELDGMIYVTMAKPDDTGEHTGDLWGWRFSSFYPDAITIEEENSGFYSIVVDDASATYSYVQTFPSQGIGTVQDAFTLMPEISTAAGIADRAPRTLIRSIRPNPSSGGPIRIDGELGRPGPIRLAVYDTAGRLVRELEAGEGAPGPWESTWDGRDAWGARVASGVYFAKLVAEGRVDAVKMVVLR
jgi:hypothetical protein